MSNKGAGISGAFFYWFRCCGGSADPGYSERGGHSVLARTGVALKSGDAADLTTRHLKMGFITRAERLALSWEADGAWC